MGFVLSEQQVERATLALSVVVLTAALLFWGRGIRRSRRSDRIAGLLVLVALCFVLARFGHSLGNAGAAMFVFGFATLPISGLAPPGSEPSERELVLTGVALMIFGFFLTLILT
jgi:hypothetical protein